MAHGYGSGLADLLFLLLCCNLLARASQPRTQVVPVAVVAAAAPGNALPLIACATMRRDEATGREREESV